MARILAVAIVLLGVLACGGGPGPEETFRHFQEVVAARDWDALYELAPPSESGAVESYWREKTGGPGAEMFLQVYAGRYGLDKAAVAGMSLRQYFHARMTAIIAKRERDTAAFSPDAEIVKTEIRGEACILTIRAGERRGRLKLVREGEDWYVPDLFRPLDY